MGENRNYTKGSGNVFRDLGFEKPEQELAKAELAARINEIIESRNLYTPARKVTLMRAQGYLEKRLGGEPAEEIQKRFWEAMEKVQDRPLPDWDKL